MKLYSLFYSDFDSLITSWFILLVFGCVFINYFFKKFKFSKRKGVFFNEDTLSQTTNVADYTFSFSNIQIKERELHSKKITLFSRITLILMALILIYVPLYEFIEVLKPEEIIYWSCFPNRPW